MSRTETKIYEVKYNWTLREFVTESGWEYSIQKLGYSRATLWQMMQKKDDHYLVKKTGRKHEIIQIKNKGKK